MAAITESVLRNDRRVYPLSVAAKGVATDDDVYLSLPAVLGKQGVSAVLRPKLAPEEEAALRKSAAAILKTKSSVENFP